MTLTREEERALDELVVWLHQISRQLNDREPRVAAGAVCTLLKKYREENHSCLLH
jgi:hypothetical protein